MAVTAQPQPSPAPLTAQRSGDTELLFGGEIDDRTGQSR